ncbi:MAG: restriction endonuclease [Candidatus Ranarchaeia archaeon]
MSKEIKYVLKADGTKEKFSENKIRKTIIRLAIDKNETDFILRKVISQLDNEVTTKMILDLIYQTLDKWAERTSYRFDLRKSVIKFRPKPDFELFIGHVFKNLGYKTHPAQVINGKCVSHEIDGVATKDGFTYSVEVKFHYKPNTYTGLDVVRNSSAILEDLNTGYKAGFHPYNITKAIIVTNTKFSFSAIKFAKCKEIQLIGWSTSPIGLEEIIEKNKLYPITVIPNLSRKHQKNLVENNILLLKQIIQLNNNRETQRRLRLSKSKINQLIIKAKSIYEKNS